MSDPERILMTASARALSLDQDRIAGTSTREGLTVEDVAFALAGMRQSGLPDDVVQRVAAALGYMTLGQDMSRWDLYRLLLRDTHRYIQKGRWPARLDGRLYHEALATLAIYAMAIPPLDHLLKGQEAPTWHRDFAQKYKELRELMDGWERIGLAHIRRRTEEPDDGGA